MARYFFHVIDGMFHPDSVGAEFPTIAQARGEASVRVIRALEQQGSIRLSLDRHLSVVVTDVAGIQLFELVEVPHHTAS